VRYFNTLAACETVQHTAARYTLSQCSSWDTVTHCSTQDTCLTLVLRYDKTLTDISISLIVSATTQTKERRCWKFCSVGVYATTLQTKKAKSKTKTKFTKTKFACVCLYNMYITFTVAIFFGGGRYWPYSAAPPVYLNSFAPGRFTRACTLGRFRQRDNSRW